MATWKKVIVSGSDISQLNNDSGYLTAATVPRPPAFATASLGTTYLLADSPAGSLNFASSSGQGLTISANTGTDTLTFGLSAIPNSSLANSTISGVSLGGALAALTAGSGLTSAGTYTGATARTFSVNSGSMASYFKSASWAGVSGDILINGSGVATIQANSVVLGTDTTGNYVATIANAINGGITVNGSGGETAAVTLSLNLNDVVGGTVDVTTDKYVFIDTTDNGTKQATLANLATAQAGTGLTATNGVFSVNSGSMSSYFKSASWAGVSGDILINGSTGVATIQANSVALSTDISGFGTGVAAALGTNVGSAGAPVLFNGAGGTPTSLTLTNATGLPISTGVSGLASNVATFLATPTSANLAAAVTDETGTGNLVFSASPTFTGTANFANISTSANVTIAGNLTVNGTTTTLNTENLLVEDPFILLGSGSASTSDGGIIIDRGSYAAGNIGFGFDSITSRWGVQGGLSDSINGIDLGTLSNGVSGSFLPYLFVEASHGVTKPVTGEFAVVGSMYMSTAGDFWIYTA